MACCCGVGEAVVVAVVVRKDTYCTYREGSWTLLCWVGVGVGGRWGGNEIFLYFYMIQCYRRIGVNLHAP